MSILNLHNCAGSRVDSPQPRPKSKFSGDKKRKDSRYAQYYESREEGADDLDSFDMGEYIRRN